MYSAASAYSRTQKQTANPRELESQLLLKAGARLQAVVDGTTTDPAEIFDALNYNRRLWTILLSAVLEPDNQLPHEVRQNFANLAIFVVGQTKALELNPDVSKMPMLVRFCRDIAQGLRSVTAAPEQKAEVA
jgi:flagellar protein FlaF